MGNPGLDEYQATADQIAVIAGALVALIIVYGILRSASLVATWVRPSVARAISQLVGLVVAAIAIHFIASAIGEWFNNGVL